MSTEVKVPALGESITEAIVMEWLVAEGDAVAVDQDLVVLETDKITVNVPSPVAGVMRAHKAQPDDEIEVGTVIALIDEGAEAGGDAKAKGESKDDSKGAKDDAKGAKDDAKGASDEDAPTEEAPPSKAAERASSKGAPDREAEGGDGDSSPLMPAVRRLLTDKGIDPSDVVGTGRGGRILKGDVLRYIEAGDEKPVAKSAAAAPDVAIAALNGDDGVHEELVKMTKLRRTIARRLVEAQQTAAILTTFNEVDMSAVIAARTEYKAAFADKHGVKLGFTSFFAKAAIEALKAFPEVNAEIRDDHIAYKRDYHIGVAVGGGRGLVVPVVKHADRLSFAEFEKTLNDLAQRARDNALTLDELRGGTFTISNGGVYGSLLSTPILNPPQVGILGLHKIEERPVAVNGQVEVRPMMYLALSYDHRIIDGRGAVSFLVKLKACIEDPNRMLLEV